MKTEKIIINGAALTIFSGVAIFEPAGDIYEIEGGAYAYTPHGPAGGIHHSSKVLHHAIAAGFTGWGAEKLKDAAAGLLKDSPELCEAFRFELMTRCDLEGDSSIYYRKVIEDSPAWIRGHTYTAADGTQTVYTMLAKAFIDDQGQSSIHTIYLPGVNTLDDAHCTAPDAQARLLDAVDIFQGLPLGKAYLTALLQHIRPNPKDFRGRIYTFAEISPESVIGEVVAYIQAYGITLGE